MSNARMRLGDRPGALAALDASLAEVEDPRAYALRAEYLRREDPQAALADLERAAELDPTPARRFEAGALAWRAGSAERAVELLAALAQEQPDLPDVHHELGNAYRTLGRNAEADAALTAQLERAGPETNLGGVHWARLQVRRALGDLDGALEDAERLHAHVPESGEGRFLPALLRLERGEEGARATLEREVARTAANEALAGYDRVCLALAWERLGEPERACGALYGLKDGALSAITRNYAFDPWLPGLLQRYCELLLDGRDFDHGVDVATLWLQRYAGSGHPGEDGLRRLVEREGGRAE